ncbi:MAG TPA: YggS family pyridoxal phosphate-dependent enzyme [Gemmatimonadaceae bacterium]|jgi:pyridoxal phosphate enzyme (YggS family)|nr:YggS family pyridoxal phosphate-dependent enzyme [Gemmatimonadaceae bacterium]
MPFPELPDRVAEVRGRIAAAVARGGHGQVVTLVAVTKTHGPDAVLAAVEAGVPDVGENKVQEALGKMDAVHVAARWHLIGHLQRNKVKAVPRFVLTHSMDRASLADAISAMGREQGRRFDVLMQVNVSGEDSKGGYPRPEWAREAARLRGLEGLRVRGIMTMAPLDADEATLRRTFGGAREARDVLCAAGHEATELSMGMSNDFEVAVEEGATCVRLGTILFGARA